MKNVRSTWSDKLDKRVDFVNYADIISKVNHNTQLGILARIIVQNDVKRIILGSSSLAFAFVQRYENLLRELNVSVYAYAFCDVIHKDGRRTGYIHSDIPKMISLSRKIITDNINIIDRIVDEYGVARDKFTVHYQPALMDIRNPIQNNHRPLRILWASRVCAQKRPDILVEVAKRLDQSQFTVDAYGVLEEDFTEQYFENSPVNYKGQYNGVSEIPLEDYDIFLYTSEMDGIPNVLQEMTAAGLPIVASKVGGIAEFIDNEQSGLLANEYEDPETYVRQILKLKNRDLRYNLTKNAQEKLHSMFNEATWKKAVERDIDQ
jgi:glycosyltransferase involved in cell wall biosynthesis